MGKLLEKLKDEHFRETLKEHLTQLEQEEIKIHNAKIRKKQIEEQLLLQQEHEDRETEEILFR